MLLVFFRQKRLFSYKKGIALFSTLFYNCTVEIYIEKVIIENYLYTYLIIALSCLILKYKVSFLRKCLGAVVATILAIVSAYMVLNPIGNILYKLLTAYFICYVTLPCKSFKYQIINFLIFMLLSFMYGGILLILYFSLESVGLVFDTMPIYIVMLSILIISKICKSIIRTVSNKTKIQQFTYQIELIANDKSVITNAYLDSGNFLVDNMSQKPVILINYKVANELLNLEIEDILTKNYQSLKNYHYINISTANKKSKLLVFEINSVSIKTSEGEKVIKMPVLGLSMSKFRLATDCDVLISSEILNYV